MSLENKIDDEVSTQSGEKSDEVQSAPPGVNPTPEGFSEITEEGAPEADSSPDDDDSSRISDATSDEESDQPTGESDDEPDTFPREYVEKLRDENAKYRQRAQQVDEYAERLHAALTAATGRLQDPSDLSFDQSHLDDPEALGAAIQELLANKPHLASRKPSGNIGQGVTKTTETVDLAGLLRSRA